MPGADPSPEPDPVDKPSTLLDQLKQYLEGIKDTSRHDRCKLVYDEIIQELEKC